MQLFAVKLLARHTHFKQSDFNPNIFCVYFSSLFSWRNQACLNKISLLLFNKIDDLVIINVVLVLKNVL